MANARTKRGRDTEFAVAAYLRENGYPYALASGASASGTDITGLVSVDVEIKARADVPLLMAIAQQQKRLQPGVTPVVIWRPNGRGPAQIEEWVMAMPLGHGIRLLRDAGHGEPIERTP